MRVSCLQVCLFESNLGTKRFFDQCLFAVYSKVQNEILLMIGEVTYVVLIPHNVEECVEGQVEIGAAEARQRSEDAAGEEHAMQVLLGVREQLLHFLLLLWVHP